MTQITPFTAVPSRQQSQEALVTSTNTFFSEVNGFVGQANQLIGDINTAAENSVFTAPDWVAQAYESHKVVTYTDHNVYMSTSETLSTDVPSVSAKWKKLNANSAGTYDMQVFTSSGTWTKPAGVSMVRIILCGGGGGGGAGGKCGTTVAQVIAGGTGGGGGGVCDITLPASLLSATQSVIVGAKGLGGVGLRYGTGANGHPGQSGGTGGDTSFANFTVKGGGAGNGPSPSGNPISYCGTGGDSYTTDADDAYSAFSSNSSFIASCTFYGAKNEVINPQHRFFKKCTTLFGGASSPCVCNFVGYASSTTGAGTVHGGAAGGGGGGVFQSSSGVRSLDDSLSTPVLPNKFIASLFGSYTSVGGTGGSLSSLTANGSNGTNASGYGAGGGGGASCTENYTPGNGGDGSNGIAIIISW